ncbi:YigZ family protein [Helicobacter canis]|uniref:Impact N-terminal domain-containing protein n=1 Tax=Helicobacter canis TaxID=29419 RepID=A0A5M9QSF9_9HELI|nr:YigZ family protein [Helicobacter canis]KAA8711523.1 hypothetical protein F4V45_00665 [Helicobacter canis]
MQTIDKDSSSTILESQSYKQQAQSKKSCREQTSLASNAVYECKGSKFLGFALHSSELDSALGALRAAHPKAVHFVYALRAYQGGQVVERSSDDGEPKGSSGVPVLNVLRGWEMIECGIVVVRYFGGVKLGVGGLVRAYTQAAKLALESAKDLGVIVPYIKCGERAVCVGYGELRAMHYRIKKLGLRVCGEEFEANGVILHIQGDMEALQKLESRF